MSELKPCYYDGGSCRNEELIEELRAEIARLREERRWIPVEERLPEENTRVNAITNIGIGFVDVTSGMYEDGKWKDDFSFGSIEITHWQPLPAPPEQP